LALDFSERKETPDGAAASWRATDDERGPHRTPPVRFYPAATNPPPCHRRPCEDQIIKRQRHERKSNNL